MSDIIILEGPDGAGKTTVAQNLANEYCYDIIHEGPPPANVDVLEHYARLLLKAARSKKNIVFDRLHLGEHVYGNVARSNDRLTYMGVRLMRRLCWAVGARVVICLPPCGTCEKNWLEKYDHKRDVIHRREQFFDIYYRFFALAAYHEMFDYTLDVWGPFFIDGKGTATRLPPGTIGNQAADVLIVGEQPATTLDLPFFGLKNSSRFINDALTDAGYIDQEIMLTNALDAQGRRRNLDAVRESMYNFRVAIALGRKAERACKDFGLNYVFIPHPQNWKRFHARDRAKYIRLLKEAKEYEA